MKNRRSEPDEEIDAFLCRIDRAIPRIQKRVDDGECRATRPRPPEVPGTSRIPKRKRARLALRALAEDSLLDSRLATEEADDEGHSGPPRPPMGPVVFLPARLRVRKEG